MTARVNSAASVSPLARIISLVRTGPRALVLRFYDQGRRILTGTPVWGLSRITPQVYIGGQHRHVRGLEAEGITAIINLREAHHDDVAKGIGGARHLHLATRDNTPPTLDALDQGADFIAFELAQGGKVYIHCGVGVGRAPSCAAAYLIKYQAMSAPEAWRHMRQVRPFVHPTPGQRRQLMQYEQRVRAASGQPQG